MRKPLTIAALCVAFTSALVGQANNPAQIGMLRWYPANQTTIFFLRFVTPNFIAFDGTNIWVTDGSQNKVYEVRPSDGTLLVSAATPISPFGLACDGANIWVVGNRSNNITKVLAATGGIVGTYPVGRGP